jgi:hypothetical protein
MPWSSLDIAITCKVVICLAKVGVFSAEHNILVTGELSYQAYRKFYMYFIKLRA